MKDNLKIFSIAVTAALLAGLVFYLNVSAFNGPSQTPPNGYGTISVGSSTNVAIGTQIPSSSAMLLVVGSTTDNTAYGLEILDSSLGPLLTVRNDGLVAVGTSTISGGAFAGTVSAGNISSGQFGSNTGGGNYSFPAGLTATSGTVSLASTTVAGNVTTTNLTVTAVTSSLSLANSVGTVIKYIGSSCSAGNAVTGISATGTAQCGAFGSSSSNGTVTTSSVVSTSQFPDWASASSLSGTSTLSISGTTVTQANNFIVGGTLNVTSTATFHAPIVSTSTTADAVGTCGSSPSITGANGIGAVTTGSNASSTCTVTFGTAFSNAPTCVISETTSENATTTFYVTPSASNLVVHADVSSTAMKSNTFDYICIGH